MNKDIFKLVNAAFDDFISVLIRNDCDRKCLLIAKTVNDLFFSVSGTKDHKNSCKKEYFDMLQDLKRKLTNPIKLFIRIVKKIMISLL